MSSLQASGPSLRPCSQLRRAHVRQAGGGPLRRASDQPDQGMEQAVCMNEGLHRRWCFELKVARHVYCITDDNLAPSTEYDEEIAIVTQFLSEMQPTVSTSLLFSYHCRGIW